MDDRSRLQNRITRAIRTALEDVAVFGGDILDRIDVRRNEISITLYTVEHNAFQYKTVFRPYPDGVHIYEMCNGPGGSRTLCDAERQRVSMDVGEIRNMIFATLKDF